VASGLDTSHPPNEKDNQTMAHNPHNLRIVSGPTRCKYTSGDVFEVIVQLETYSSKLAYRAWVKLPEFTEFNGRTYQKGGMKASDCTAYYRTTVISVLIE
jgi:hypothetical protein